MYIPCLMCTQHPDSTVKITAGEEVDEAVVAFLAYGCDEGMVDYEGKATPYSQPRDVASKALALGLPLGERFFITPRVPNPRLEDFERSMLSLEAAVLANSYSQRAAGVQAVKWVVLPMTEDVETMAFVYKALDMKARDLAELNAVKRDSSIELIPLVEDAMRQIKIESFIKALFRTAAQSGRILEHMRIFLGISDSAVRHGHMASALAMVKALGQISEINRDGEFKISPIVGMGSPPFRGGLNNPHLAVLEAAQYAGYKTATIQSAVRYDVSYAEYQRVREAILSVYTPRRLHVEEAWITKASELYREAIRPYIGKIAELANAIPSTRDRVSWREYGRVIEGVEWRVPRAIVYTATWYFAGVPPTLLDARFIAWAYKNDVLDDVLRALPATVEEWKFESRFYSRERAEKTLGGEIVKDIDNAFDILGIKPEPDRTYITLLNSADTQPHAIALGRIRGFLG